MLDSRIKVFYEVAKTLSFTKAANALFISQPAVTKHIQALENEFGLPLFIRKGNRIYLTSAGKDLFYYAEQVEKLHQNLNDRFNLYRNEKSGELKIGASTTIAQYVLPSILAAFKNKYPNINIYLTTGNSELIANNLIKNEIDLGLVEGRVKNHDLKYEIFLQDELTLVTSSKNKSSTANEITIEQLKKLPLVLRERGSGTLEVFEYELKKHKIKLNDLNIVMYLGSTEAIKNYIANSNAYGVISVQAIKKELENNSLISIKAKHLKVVRTFDFISLQGSPISNLTYLFKKFAKQYYNKK
jgi:DNA-binding transcriptional LysR family regulator